MVLRARGGGDSGGTEVGMDLSVIIPCHNEAEALEEQLDALAAQRWEGSWEVIVVDNNSTDGTAAVARGHNGLNGRIRVVDATDGSGVAYARRVGVESSQAAAFVFCDGDDVVAPGWLAYLGDALQAHQLVTGEMELTELNDPDLAVSRGQRQLGDPPKFGDYTFVRGGNGGMTRECWDLLGGFDEEFAGLEDLEFSLRAAVRGISVHFEPNAIIHYRYRTGVRDLWHQGLFYGGSYPRLARRCRELGLRAPSRFRAIRSWGWLVVNVPKLRSRRIRLRWVWTLACRLGSARAVLRLS